MTRNPFCRRICRGVDPDEFSAIQPDDDEGIEQVESAPLDHVFGNAPLRHLKPKLEQFAMDTWRAPKRIFHAQPLDQRVQLRLDLRSALPVGAISTANSGESQPDANAPASRAG